MDKIQELLNQVAVIEKKQEAINIATGKNFNVFDLLNIERDEVKICRMLYALLDCKGSHGQGTFFLRQFCQSVLGIEMSERELASANVLCENGINNGRRIDLAIETLERFIPIEVKIDGSDLSNQCADYYQFALKKGKKEKPVLYYLTLDGKEPSKESSGNFSVSVTNDASQIRCISFEHDITFFLSQCISDRQIIQIAPIREILLQFLATIHRITNNMEDKTMDEITKLLSQSAENMRNAASIAQHLESCRTEKLRSYFETVEEIMKADGFEKYEHASTYDYNNRERNGKTRLDTLNCPGISFLIRKFGQTEDEKEIEAWVRLEICNKPYIGVCVALDHNHDQGKWTKYYNTNIPVVFECDNSNDWWVKGWHYVSAPNFRETPAFKTQNSEYFLLFDTETFNAFVDATVTQLHSMIEEWKAK